ncbi:F-box/FBD/LRR-repeat protein At1g13570-like [Camellia sinensis]|uniref:F-box/FBD/LRR-repeat protein At1g13570-like n=1 Tax=Camellia sinensis TaxID=4442 RepID=UPI0010366169|nr:F-box/FBD/LRR-repeat protein At1g13570-like [Camellia sinensis]
MNSHRYISSNDIISDLPRNIVECILEQMPIRDAGRTIILSTKWRSIWITISQLMLDNQFFEEALKIKPIVQHELVSIVDKILLLHSGPILKFVLCIPNVQIDCSSDIDRWILFLSRNGIKDLTLDNSNNKPYNLHSYIYSCPELTRLKKLPQLDYTSHYSKNSSKACTAKSIFEELVPNHLEAPDCITQMLDILRSVKISQIKGWKLELLFIKLLLAHSTMLETMFVEHCVTVDVQEGFEISKELARFPQGSPKAAIMY